MSPIVRLVKQTKQIQNCATIKGYCGMDCSCVLGVGKENKKFMKKGMLRSYFKKFNSLFQKTKKF